MSVSTSATVSSSLPTVQQLLSAVQSNGTLPSPIQNLFGSTPDKALGERPHNNMEARIIDARRVYQIVQAGAPPFAVFYKLNGPKEAAKKTSEAFYKVLAKAAKRPTNYKDLEAVIDYHKEEGRSEEQLVAEEMSVVLSAHINAQHKQNNSQVTQEEVFKLFNKALEEKAINVSIDSFFTVPNRETAGKIGIIYNPQSNDVHNWGVNAVWTAALAARGTSIKILSPLLLESGMHPAGSRFTVGSSAFALEIAIAIKMGYTLEFTAPDEPRSLDEFGFVDELSPAKQIMPKQIKLLPPPTPQLDVTLPTREEQEQIYVWCCSKQAEAIQQFTAASPPSSASSPSVITFPYRPAISLNSKPVLINTEVLHTPPTASILNQFQLQRSKTAGHAVSASLNLNSTSADTLDPKQKPTPSTSSGINP